MRVTPELSIIVPVLDETATLADLFATLGHQADVCFELLICDGGSTDGTPELARKLAGGAPFPCRVLRTGKGRAIQMNAGAAAADADFLLFLHVDTIFPDSLDLRRGLTALKRHLIRRGDHRAAGRYALRFRHGHKSSLPYTFYEAKAGLDRPGCIHGDQGMLLPKSLFEAAGPFDQRLPLLEDDRLAGRIRAIGEWVLLPAQITTSTRRFEIEGLRQRQTLNALLMNFAAIGWDEFFRAAPGVYRQQAKTGRLQLAPFFQLIRDLLKELPLRDRLRLWYLTGGYVRENAWQLAFWFDVRRSYRRGPLPQGLQTSALNRYDRWLDPLTDHPPGRLAAALVTWTWFRIAGWVMARSRPRAGCTIAEGD